MLYEILERCTSILNEIANIGDTQFQAVIDIPENIREPDYGIFTAFMLEPTHTQDNSTPKEFPNQIAFPGVCLGKQVKLGYSSVNRRDMFRYADAISKIFIERPQLNDTNMYPLPGVTEAIFQGGQIINAPYPPGSTELIYYQYRFSLAIKYSRYRTLSD